MVSYAHQKVFIPLLPPTDISWMTKTPKRLLNPGLTGWLFQ
jgi:hypothetical protein